MLFVYFTVYNINNLTDIPSYCLLKKRGRECDIGVFKVIKSNLGGITHGKFGISRKDRTH